MNKNHISDKGTTVGTYLSILDRLLRFSWTRNCPPFLVRATPALLIYAAILIWPKYVQGRDSQKGIEIYNMAHFNNAEVIFDSLPPYTKTKKLERSRFIYDDVPLLEILGDLAKYYHVTVFNPKNVRGGSVVATFELADGLKRAIKTLSLVETQFASVKLKNDTIFVGPYRPAALLR